MIICCSKTKDYCWLYFPWPFQATRGFLKPHAYSDLYNDTPICICLAICEMNHSIRMKYGLAWLAGKYKVFLSSRMAFVFLAVMIQNLDPIYYAEKGQSGIILSQLVHTRRGRFKVRCNTARASVRTWLFLATKISLIRSFKILVIPCALIFLFFFHIVCEQNVC